jgi:hypothetical protein
MIVISDNLVVITPIFIAKRWGNIVEINKKDRFWGKEAELIWENIKEKAEKIQKGENTDALIYADDKYIISFGIVFRRVGRVILLNREPIVVENPEEFWESVIESLRAQSVYRVVAIPKYIDNEISRVELSLHEEVERLKNEIEKIKKELGMDKEGTTEQNSAENQQTQEKK